MKYMLTALLLLFIVFSHAQGFFNLDFEYEAEYGQPRKWFIETEGDKCVAKLTKSEFHKGGQSLEISVLNGQAITYLTLPKNLIAGKTLRVRTFLKFVRADSLEVMLGLKDPMISKPMMFPVAKGKNDSWSPAFLEMNLANYTSDKILLAVVIVGSGKILIDDVMLSTDDHVFTDIVPDFTQPSQQLINAIKKNAIAIGMTGKGDEGEFGRMVGTARVIGLGENSHGSSSVNKLKLKMVKELVENRGFTIFALESPAVEADVINDYVLGSNIDKSDVVRNLVYPAWKTEDMLVLVDWIRNYNQKNSNKIQFRGFDIQDGQSALTKITALCERVSPHLVEIIDSLKTLIDKKSQFTEQLALISRLENRLKTFSGNNVESERRLKSYIFILSQNIKLQSGEIDRDKGMAETIRYIANSSGSKIILSGDNTHITKSSGKMGSYLFEYLGKDYLSLGITFGYGTYSAYGPNNPYEVHPPYTGTAEYVFKNTGIGDFILDLRSKDLHFMLHEPLGFRSIGSRPQETTQFSEISLPLHFDIVSYIDKSVHTKFPIE